MANETSLPNIFQFAPNLAEHNPDSQCLKCCEINAKFEMMLESLERVIEKLSDSNAVDDLPPMFKLAAKFIK